MTSRWSALRSWHDDWSGLRVVVLGLDAHGFAVADTLAELGARVTVFSDGGHAPDREQLLSVIDARLEVVGSDVAAAEAFDAGAFELLVVTPASGAGHPLVSRARERGVDVAGEVELAWRLRDKVGTAAPWLLVAGGQTAGRTAHLTESMLLAAGTRVMACGDTLAGVPVLDAIRVPEGWEGLVVAVTAADLQFSSSLSPLASVCLDSGDGDAAGPLARVYDATQVACVYNRGDEATMRMVEQAEVVDGCRAIGFGLGVPGPSDFGVVEGILCDRAFLEERHASALEFATVDLLAAAGLGDRQGVADVLAAAALARAAGSPIDAVHAALRGAVQGSS